MGRPFFLHPFQPPQIYIPLTLIVMCSWVTFWLSKTERGSEIPARTGLGASSVLSVVTIGFGGKSKPQVSEHCAECNRLRPTNIGTTTNS